MPGVDSIQALFAAAEAFDARPLGLQVDPDADAAVRDSLRQTGLVLLGEMHGVAQTPVLLEELIAWFGLGGIALEWHEDLMPWLESWIAYGTPPNPDDEHNPAVAQIWGGDGRLTAGHLATLRRWARSGLSITLMDGMTTVFPRTAESNEQMDRRLWTERDSAMADRVLAAEEASGGRLVVAGNLHTHLVPSAIGDPMGAHLARQRPGLCSIECVYGSGSFHNLGPRRHFDRLPEHQINAPRLIWQRDAVLLLVPSPREAIVPHRRVTGIPR